jgi:hypothetical protein
MSKRLTRRYKKHDVFAWIVNTWGLSNEWLLDEVLSDVAFDLLPPKNGTTDEEGTLQYIQDVRDGKRETPQRWLYELTCVLSQNVERAIASGTHFEKTGAPVWYGPLPSDGNKFGQVLVLMEMLSIFRDVPLHLLEPSESAAAD